jgi:hypothetical protein
MTNVSAAESATAKLLSEDEGDGFATNIAKHARQHAADMYAGAHIQAVEDRWKSSG